MSNQAKCHSGQDRKEGKARRFAIPFDGRLEPFSELRKDTSPRRFPSEHFVFSQALGKTRMGTRIIMGAEGNVLVRALVGLAASLACAGFFFYCFASTFSERKVFSGPPKPFYGSPFPTKKGPVIYAESAKAVEPVGSSTPMTIDVIEIKEPPKKKVSVKDCQNPSVLDNQVSDCQRAEKGLNHRREKSGPTP